MTNANTRNTRLETAHDLTFEAKLTRDVPSAEQVRAMQTPAKLETYHDLTFEAKLTRDVPSAPELADESADEAVAAWQLDRRRDQIVRILDGVNATADAGHEYGQGLLD
jgi:hypothetical protein